MKYRMNLSTAKGMLAWVMQHTNNEAISCQCEQVLIELHEIGMVEYHKGVIRSVVNQFYRDLPQAIKRQIQIVQTPNNL